MSKEITPINSYEHIKKQALLQKAYELLRKQTPLQYDCGRLCDSLCCKGDENMGMNLFPGEEDMLACDEYSIKKSKANLGYSTLLCGGGCLRDFRPLACRIYPLFPIVTKDENGIITVSVVYDPRAKQNCPLAKFEKPLNRNFVTAVRRAGKDLIKDKEILEYLLDISEKLIEIDELEGLLRNDV